jgi:transcriptional regulator with XRE-family HTH domain
MAEKQRKASTLGDRVRRLRVAHGMTLSQLSTTSGISVATLSKLENGLTGLNLENIIRLAGGFSMPVSILLNEGSAASGACSVSRDGGAYSHELTELDFQVLHNDLPAQKNIFWKVCVKSRTMTEFGPYHSHPGEEFFYVLSGAVKFLIRGRDPMRLKAGDSVQFDSALEHAYLSVGTKDALILMSNTITGVKVPGYIDWGTADGARNVGRAYAAGKTVAQSRRKSSVRKSAVHRKMKPS